MLNYAYLWRDQYRRGLEEGTKNRPCLVVAIEPSPDGQQYVTVAPVTHHPPQDFREALEIPSAIKQSLGLDEQPSWIVLTDLNRFRWPGEDIRQIPSRPTGTFSYGVMPSRLFCRIAASIPRLTGLQPTPR